MDISKLHEDIRAALPEDPLSTVHLPTLSDPWTLNPSGLLLRNNHIYVPNANDLQLRVLQYKHDHILSGHFGQNKTLALIRQDYFWPNMRELRHKPYGELQQLPIPEKPWNSISMDFIEKLPDSAGYSAILPSSSSSMSSPSTGFLLTSPLIGAPSSSPASSA
ncbi:hypothetical protein AX17_007150 [Amanita inopinata Kibby_2008]|nr:hypothetical protein AX17_007150 [Amanita inopinata Kibby_2008]